MIDVVFTSDETLSKPIESLVDSTIVNVYLQESLVELSVLPVYRNSLDALINGAARESLYFNWNGALSKVPGLNLITNLTLNLSKAVSYLRRIF